MNDSFNCCKLAKSYRMLSILRKNKTQKESEEETEEEKKTNYKQVLFVLWRHLWNHLIEVDRASFGRWQYAQILHDLMNFDSRDKPFFPPRCSIHDCLLCFSSNYYKCYRHFINNRQLLFNGASKLIQWDRKRLYEPISSKLHHKIKYDRTIYIGIK